MAAFTKLISFLFFIMPLLFSHQISARESQFFSKVNHFDSNNNNVKENEFPSKETPVNKPEKEPVFIPETKNSYGLYGHETGQNPPSTTTNYAPYTTPTTTTTFQPYKAEAQEEMNKYDNNKNMYYSYHKDAYVYDNSNNNQNDLGNTKLTSNAYGSDNNNHNYYNKNAYGTHRNEQSNTRYTEGGYSTLENEENTNKYEKYYSNYNNNGAEVNQRYNGEKKGMSDTRFMENGKYFYDINKEKYNPTFYNTHSNKGSVESRNWNNYFGNNNNKGNFYENNYSKDEFQDEFAGDDGDFWP